MPPTSTDIMKAMNRRLFTLFTLIVLLWELLDPSTSFIRSYVVPDSGSLSKSSPFSKKVIYTSAVDQDSGETDVDDSGPSVLDTDQVHYSCVVLISVFDFDASPTTAFVDEAISVLPDHDSGIFQPPKRT